jgi:peptidoglycan/LPS O-acetylase OafA/YrhL
MLACLVVASHCGLLFYGYNEGVVAVVSFMMLSGFVMSIIINASFNNKGTESIFYVDRFFRLVPNFIFYSIVSFMVIHFTAVGIKHVSWMDYKTCSTPILLLNFSMIANNFNRVFGDCMLLPASWSLGLEASFYAIAPFLLRRANRLTRFAAAAISIVFFLCAYFGVIDADLYAYRLLPGTLIIFLAGAALADQALFPRRALAIVWLCALVLYVGSRGAPAIYDRPYLKEVLVGFLLGAPILAVLSKRPFSAVDEFAGSLSYGVYLNHIMLIWIGQAYFGMQSWRLGSFAVLLLAASLLAALTCVLVERPALSWRRRIRSAHRLSQA